MTQAVNNFTLTGHISKKPEIRETKNGKKYSFVTIAVNGLNKDQADFISVILWEKLAENTVKYCGVGDCISVHGSISTVTREKVTTLQLTGDVVTFLHKAAKKEEKKEETPANPMEEFSDPFAPI